MRSKSVFIVIIFVIIAAFCLYICAVEEKHKLKVFVSCGGELRGVALCCAMDEFAEKYDTFNAYCKCCGYHSWCEEVGLSILNYLKKDFFTYRLFDIWKHNEHTDYPVYFMKTDERYCMTPDVGKQLEDGLYFIHVASSDSHTHHRCVFFLELSENFIGVATPLNVDNISEFPYEVYTINESQFEDVIRAGELRSELTERADFTKKSNYILMRKGVYAFKLKESFLNDYERKGKHFLRWFVINAS